MFSNWAQMAAGYMPESCGMSGKCNCYFVVDGNGNVYPCDFYCTDEWKLGTAGRSQWLKENPKAAIAISKALIRSQEETEKNPTDVYKKLATKDSPESIFKEVYSYDETFSFFKPDITDDYINRAKSIEKFMEDNKLIESTESRARSGEKSQAQEKPVA